MADDMHMRAPAFIAMIKTRMWVAHWNRTQVLASKWQAATLTIEDYIELRSILIPGSLFSHYDTKGRRVAIPGYALRPPTV